MLKRFIKNILALAACWAGLSTCAFCQQTDSAAAVIDSVQQQTTEDSSIIATTGSDTVTKAALSKFAMKEDTLAAHERKIPQAEVKKIANDKDFWYANKPMPGDEPIATNDVLGNIFLVVFWLIVAVIVIGVVIICLRMFYGKGKYIPVGETGAESDEPNNIFEFDFDSRINAALEAQDYRLATRLLFLRLLRSMAERNVIKYSMEKTNFDYLFELGNTRYFKDFSTLARNYEYVWYGNFNIQQSQFLLLRQRLDAFNQEINN